LVDYIRGQARFDLLRLFVIGSLGANLRTRSPFVAEATAPESIGRNFAHSAPTTGGRFRRMV
jgi:hypothetical protein